MYPCGSGPCPRFFLSFRLSARAPSNRHPLPGSWLNGPCGTSLTVERLLTGPAPERRRWRMGGFAAGKEALTECRRAYILYSSPRFSIRENRPLSRPTVRRFEIARKRVTVRGSVEADTSIGDVPERAEPRFSLGRAGCHTPFQNRRL